MTEATVSLLKVVPQTRAAQPQGHVVEFLERLVKRARSGELQSIMVAYVRDNGRPAHGYSWGERGTDCYPMGTALMMAQHDFLHEMEQTLVDVPPADEPA